MPVYCRNGACGKLLIKADFGGDGYVIICDLIVVTAHSTVATCKRCKTKTTLPLEIRLGSAIVG